MDCSMCASPPVNDGILERRRMTMADSPTKLSVETEAKPAAPVDRWWPLDSLRSEIDRVFNDFGSPSIFDRAFGRMPAAFSRGMLAVDLVESEKAFELSAELPGVDAKDLDVTLADGVLTIKGEKNETKEEKEKDYYLSERRYGSFHRSLELPRGVDSEKIEANFSNGVLKVSLPKTLERQQNGKKITVKAA
ncbi:Hsp20/alpha crystallin family protein [Rhizobium leguminosarum]|nr:Hsp20/alpha crystallin family protein [Rhizobium leguminosarum]TBG67873.1 Hsp20/alpha crystallin family protein [Rhizobium leguminosarum]TBH01655.1 Hsp20/alpha crystallin family protein [Rhizobium leguminosarum]TBH11189.1 Hsp20/alpha crystallin family protein [Rhizobium leguminosarum]TBH35934.1 Hsp20/alpha crystallin family protein [Rhizobium leguminosarum]